MHTHVFVFRSVSYTHVQVLAELYTIIYCTHRIYIYIYIYIIWIYTHIYIYISSGFGVCIIWYVIYIYIFTFKLRPSSKRWLDTELVRHVFSGLTDEYACFCKCITNTTCSNIKVTVAGCQSDDRSVSRSQNNSNTV
jgi:hypothetical protein